jgi:hypothetical protein
MVREFEDAPGDHLILVVDTWLPPENDRHAPHGSRNGDEVQRGNLNGAILHARTSALEDAISFAATVCWEWCRQPGNRFVLGVAGEESAIHDGATGRALGLKILESLALQQGTSNNSGSDIVGRLASIPLPPAPVLLISANADRLGASLSRQLNRPVVSVDATSLESLDFYEGPELAEQESRGPHVFGGG